MFLSHEAKAKRSNSRIKTIAINNTITQAQFSLQGTNEQLIYTNTEKKKLYI